MAKKFFDLPIEQKIPLTKESIQKELETHEGGYPKHVSMNSNYMLEIFEYVEQLQKMHKTNVKIAEHEQKDRRRFKKDIEWAFDELNHAYLTGDIEYKDKAIKEVMVRLEESLEK